MRPASPPEPGGRRLTVLFEGRPVLAREGDTVAAALLREGVRVFSRGPKYHRPRGPFCLAGTCAQCHMRIGGEPNVPACRAPVSEGLTIERQNALGSADTDLLRAIDYVYPTGLDHHHLLTRFRPLNAAARAVARRLAGLGRPPDEPLPVAPARSRSAPLVVVGAGRTGLAVAAAAARAGLRPLLVEESATPCPRLLDLPDSRRGPESARIEWLLSETTAHGRGEVWLDAPLVWLGEEAGARRALVRRGGALVSLDIDRLVLATGDEEFPHVFENNDLPGHFAGRGLLRFVRRFGFAPGTTAVVARTAADDEALELVHTLRRVGVTIAAFVHEIDVPEPAGDPGIPLRRGRLVRASGGQTLEGVVVEADSVKTRIDCDLLAVCGHTSPKWELAGEAGAAIHFREHPPGFVPTTDDRGRSTIGWLWIAGRAAGHAGRVRSDDDRSQLARRLVESIADDVRTTPTHAGGVP